MTDEGRQNMQLWEEAMRHIKAGDFDAALKLYDDPDALASERRVIERHIEKAKAIRHRVNTEE